MTSSESRRMNYLTRGEPRSISGQRQNGLLAAPWSFCSRRRRTMSDRVSTWRSVIGASTLRSKQGCEICACNGARLNEKEFLREGNRRLHTMKGKLHGCSRKYFEHLIAVSYGYIMCVATWSWNFVDTVTWHGYIGQVFGTSLKMYVELRVYINKPRYSVQNDIWQLLI